MLSSGVFIKGTEIYLFAVLENTAHQIFGNFGISIFV